MLKFRQSASSTNVGTIKIKIEDNKSDKCSSQNHDETAVYKALRSPHLSLSLTGGGV